MTINFVPHISDLVISQIGLSRTLVDANGIIDALLYVFVVTLNGAFILKRRNV